MISLQQKYQRQLSKILAFIYIPFVVILFLVINYFTQDEIKELLYFQSDNIENAIYSNSSIEGIYPIFEVKAIDNDLQKEDAFQKVWIFDKLEGEEEEYYELKSIRRINEKTYEITTRSTAVEQKDLFLGIFFSTLLLLILLSSIFYFWNQRILKKLWTPFQRTLHSLKSFTLTDQNPIIIEETEIQEFHDFASISNSLTGKLISDYNNLKQFTENASHEIQTPLAIIQLKAEELINTDGLSKFQSENITDIYDSCDRLSKLNKGLLLLTKIENHQFDAKKRLDIGEYVGKEILWIEEHYLEGKYQVQVIEDSCFILSINPILAEILIRNLMMNMVLHSSSKKDKVIYINDKSISFSNHGENSLAKPNRLFDRFYKESNSVKSLGLGLAISKAICEYSLLDLNYSYTNGCHVFEVKVNV